MSTYQNKSIERLCRLGIDDSYVMVKMHSEIKDFLGVSAESRGLTLSEECYLRLCESIENNACTIAPNRINPTLYDFIFNENIAVDETKLRRR